ncbi:Vacuolar protein sorting-associated protein 1, partial [Bienertia sinuspersici]
MGEEDEYHQSQKQRTAFFEHTLIPVLILSNNGNNGGDGLEYGELLHLPGKKFYDLRECWEATI